MKLFWLIIALLVLGGGVAFFTRTDAPRTRGVPITPSNPPAMPAPELPDGSEPRAVATPAPAAEVAAAVPEAQPALTRTAPAPGEAAAQPAIALTVPSGELDLDEILGTSAPRVDLRDAASTSPLGESQGAAAGGATPVPEVPAKLGEWDVAPASFAARDDGSLLVDGRFIVRGAGTADDPLRVPWDLLISAQESFDPANRLVKMPARVAMLHQKTVRIDGYVAFPLMSPRPTELLAMLNQWDGCCLGAPPTAYDAVEVKLLKPVSGDDRFAINGHVVGEFRVEPFVSGSAGSQWLVGMYTMRNASFVSGDLGGGPAH